jgi:hypothetical protein
MSQFPHSIFAAAFAVVVQSSPAQAGRLAEMRAIRQAGRMTEYREARLAIKAQFARSRDLGIDLGTAAVSAVALPTAASLITRFTHGSMQARELVAAAVIGGIVGGIPFINKGLDAFTRSLEISSEARAQVMKRYQLQAR